MNAKTRLMAAAVVLATMLPLSASAAPAAASPASNGRPAEVVTSTSGSVLAAAECMARWQLARLASTAPPPPIASAGPVPVDSVLAQFGQMESAANPRSWHQATFWLGMTELADRTSATWLDEAIGRSWPLAEVAVG